MGDLQRGDLQLPRAARRTGGQGPPTADSGRHRDPRSSVRGLRPRDGASPDRHVRVRDLGQEANRQLFLARDRMGIKPLYYCRQGDDFVFASEIKAFFLHPQIHARPSQEGLWHYLTYRSVPSPATMFEDIVKVRPGHCVTFSEKELRTGAIGTFRSSRRSASAPTPTIPDKSQEVESRLTTSVKRRLISDVPLGAFLSGGVDSSLIVALMSQLTNAPVRTYSVGFRDFPASELPYAPRSRISTRRIITNWCSKRTASPIISRS